MRLITVLLADDILAMRDGLRSLLKAEPDLSLVGEAEDGLQAVAMAAKLCPDVILMDLSMPRLNGLEAMQRILKLRPATRVLMLSAHTDEAYVMRAKSLGASGYLSKHADLGQLPDAMRLAVMGGSFVGPQVSRPDPSPKKVMTRSRGSVTDELDVMVP